MRRPIPAVWIVSPIVGLAMVVGAGPAFAQSLPDSRVAVNLDVAYRLTTASFSQAVTFEQYSEAGSLTAAYALRRRPAADVGVVVRLWRGLGVGLAGSYSADSGSPAQVAAAVPNPLVFGQPRHVAGPADVSSRELGVHILAAYWLQPSPRLQIVVSGGPSRFRVDQDFVAEVQYSQTYPYVTATFQGASLVRERQTAPGGNIGGEVAWTVARHVAVGGVARYAHAAADFPGTSATSVAAGGLHLGAGLHFLF